MAKAQIDLMGVGGAQIWEKDTALDVNGTVTITDCPFSPDMVLGQYLIDVNNFGIVTGGADLIQLSAAIANGSSGYCYAAGVYGASVSGNTISIKTGMSISISKPIHVTAIKK